MTTPDYMKIVNHYEKRLKEHGVSHKGVDWPNLEDVHRRFKVMLEVFPEVKGKRLLDLGCGFGLLVDYLEQQKIDLDYTGIDLSPAMISEAKKLHPKYNFRVQDILKTPLEESYDIIVMNGLLTVKSDVPFQKMENFAKTILAAAFEKCTGGMAFNVMSAQVDWERDDLFHWPFDKAASFIKSSLSRHFAFRQDYGLYEYATYVYRNSQ